MACVSALTIASISSSSSSSLSINNPLLRPSSVHPLIPLFNSVKSPLKSRQCIQRFPFRRSSSSGWLTEKRHQASSESRVGTNHEEEEEKEEISRATLIWRAIKLPIYSVALVPLTVGSAAAYLQAGVFSAKRYFVLLSSSILIITWLNLSNDVYDFDTGADKNKKESVVNIFGSRTGTLIAAYVLLALGFMGLTWAYAEAANIRPMLLLTCAVIFGYIYQCPPFRLSYQGLGEPLCFAAFGPFATTAFYLMHRSEMYLPITGTVLSASLLVGLTTTLILFCSHFHQVDEDSAVGKLSPLVRIGTKTGSQVVKVAVVTLYSLLFALGLSKLLPITSVVLCALTLPIGIFVVRFVEGNHSDKGKIFMAKYYCVRLHAAFGAALSVGMMIARTTVSKSYHNELKIKNNNSIEALDFFWVICFYYFPSMEFLLQIHLHQYIADRKRHHKDIILACCGSTELINNYPWRTARLGD